MKRKSKRKKRRTPQTTQQKIELALKMYDSKDYLISEIEQATSVSKSSLYRYLKNRT
ncbi:helix-turn-helix domain-containing protein [Parabacteroides merdae]|uniref:helix-turn-helix domain-containing protein n=1 Tax=Parabacteroides merdae TaxID=46503 RepID=UPI0028700C1F|nr:helix-turn-helix domain-containing protein [Parabacteroides merdae]